jgi:hypothetical protein
LVWLDPNFIRNGTSEAFEEFPVSPQFSKKKRKIGRRMPPEEGI